MRYLDQEEREILEALESGKLKRAEKAPETQQRHKEYAEARLREQSS